MSIMKPIAANALAQDLLQVMKGFPRLNFREYTIEGLTTSEKGLLVMVMMNLEDGQKGLPASDISDLLRITPGGVTHLLNPLEEQGYIERLPDQKDRRIVRIGLTRKGAQAARTLVAEAQRQLVGLVEHLGEQDSRILIELLSRAVVYFSKRPVSQAS
jgi:DNA-binding MarR family transcriptional regulator